jgi:hypothetical protein
MKEYNIYKSGDYYNVKYGDGYGSYYKTYDECVKEVSKYYTMGNFVEVESESEISDRLQREKALKRNNKIDQILG